LFRFTGACSTALIGCRPLPCVPSSDESLSVRELHSGERIGLHVEVAFRAKPPSGRNSASAAAAKLDEDLTKLQGSIDEAVAHEHDALPWTCLVLIDAVVGDALTALVGTAPW
jgi:hypothetical protein